LGKHILATAAQIDVNLDSLSVNSDILSTTMKPHLIAISGPFKGTIFALSQPETSIGRDRTNTIVLNEPSVSRCHCLIKRSPALQEELNDAATPGGSDSDPQQFTIFDRDSYNGTFVNSVPVKEQLLKDGDQVAVGDVLLLFLLRDGETTAGVTSELNEVDLITRSTIRLRREDALYLQSESLLAELPPSDRVARNLKALFSISRTLGSINTLDELQSELFKLILEVIPVQREAILLVDRGAQTFSSTRGWSRFLGPDDSIKGSQTITTQVLREGVALLSNDLATADLGQTPSLLSARVCSVLCVPLVVFNQSLGVVYLDTSDPSARFDEDHLQLLTAIAAIASAAFENARQLEWTRTEYQRLKDEIAVDHQMIGQSPAMETVYRFIGRAAPSDSTVLIRGESGTGKELAARAVHLNSERAGQPFVAINGATLSETLLESELFGHVKGAFTGAINQKQGKLELADGGTLFLDEVAELTPLIQAKLLRVLQEMEFERVGGTRPIKVNVRLVTATNKNLEDAVAAGTFRQDLYYRLNVVSVTMPPLRDRGDDVQLLASYFCAAYSRKCKRRINGISPEARGLLGAYDWPGNVRELQNVIERAIVLGGSELITPDDLPETLLEIGGPRAPTGSNFYEQVKEAKRRIVVEALEATQGNYAAAARRLGLNSPNLHRLIRNLDLKAEILKKQ
jgi:transcriptional regulator with GAF, ATPase, and Fis domain